MRAALLTGLLLAAVLGAGGFLALGAPARTGMPAVDLRVQTAEGPRAERRRERAAHAAGMRSAAGAAPAPAPAPAPVGDDVENDDADDRDSADDD